MLLRLFCLLILLVPCVDGGAAAAGGGCERLQPDGQGALQRFDALLVQTAGSPRPACASNCRPVRPMRVCMKVVAAPCYPV